MNKFYCDICGDEIKYSYYIIDVLRTNVNSNFIESSKIRKDICLECF